MGKQKKKRQARVKIYQPDIDCHWVKQQECGCSKVFIYDRGKWLAAGYEEMCARHVER